MYKLFNKLLCLVVGHEMEPYFPERKYMAKGPSQSLYCCKFCDRVTYG